MWICSPEGRAVIEQADAQLVAHPGDPLAASTSLRRLLPELAPELAAAALDQARLARLAADRYGIDAHALLLTRDGLEQATRPEVARLRAELLQQAGAQTVVDLTAGLGFDARALLSAGLTVIAVERDATTAAFLRVNAPAAEVVQADALEVATGLLARLQPTDVVFIDPARRSGRRTLDGSRAHPERDPERWSPPWSFVTSLADQGIRVCAKVAPGFAADLLPTGWCGIWTSVQRTMVEAMVCSWDIGAARTARAIGARVVDFASTAPCISSASALEQWLHEPDPSLVNAGLLDEFCAAHPSLARVDEQSTWLTSSADFTHAMLRSYEVRQELPNDVKGLRKSLNALGVGDLTIKCRGMGIDADAMRKQLRLFAGGPGTVVITTVQGQRTTVLVHDHR
ncbi:MAG: class I SAM-dependent methyltransferase [Candidatus Nanopelagicales bacterium]